MEQQKECSVCGKTKPLSSFGKNEQILSGLHYACKECNAIACSKYRKSKDGVVSNIYNSQVSHSRNRNYPPPTYAKDELKEWMLGQELFHTLYDNWVASDYNKWVKPSIDRIDDYKGYSFDNIQLITWQENLDKAHVYTISGITRKRLKAVFQHDKCGNFIKEHYSQTQAGRETGILQTSINNNLRGDSYSAGSFVWTYKD